MHPVAVLVVDPRFVLVPGQFKRAVERQQADPSAAEVVQLTVPSTLIPALSQPTSRLNDSDDPGTALPAHA